jgi:hypothetical protein
MLLALAMLAACAGAPPPAGPLHIDAPEGYALSFPAPVQTRIGREGPVLFRIDAARTPDGARFEAAWFGFPEPLEAAERAALRDRVERGLSTQGGVRVVSRSEAREGGRDALDMEIDRPDGKRGYHRVLYPSPQAMLQVSAVGPRGGEWEGALKPFLASLSLLPPSRGKE